MKRLFSVIVLIIVLLNGVSVSAYEENPYKTYTEGEYSYFFNEDGGITISSYNGTDNKVVIPSEISGKSVTCIGEEALCSSDYIQDIVISEGITQIDDHAFAYCENLKSVKLPYSLTYIGKGAFCSCAIEELLFPKDIKVIARYAFENCTSLKKLHFESSETIYHTTAFNNTPFEESYKDNHNLTGYLEADNSPLPIKKIKVFLRGLSIFGTFNGDVRFMSAVQYVISLLLFAFIVASLLVLVGLLLYFAEKFMERKLGEANKLDYLKYSASFVKEFSVTDYGMGKYKKVVTLGETLFKRAWTIIIICLLIILLFVSLGVGVYFSRIYFRYDKVMLILFMVSSLVIIPAATGLLILLLSVLTSVLSRIRYWLLKSSKPDKKVMRIVNMKKWGVKYE